ncbi:MAG: adenine phosphoribosyltransferase [Gemmatimonadaceae bacterium]
MAQLEADVRAAIRDIPDFPKPGIMFKDITPLLADAELFQRVTAAMADPFRGAGITHVVAIESRGFLLGAPVAQALNAGLIPVRKPGKLPGKTASVEYALEYGTDRLEIHADACDHAAKVLIVDDVLATGGTAKATAELVRGRGAAVSGFSFLLILSFLDGAKRLDGIPTRRVVEY